MNKLSYFTIGALVIAVLTIGIIGYSVRTPVVNNIVKVEPSEVVVGATPGPNLPNIVNFGGTTHYYYHSSFNPASSTLCSFLGPTATSTLVNAFISFTTGTSTELVVSIGKSNDNNAATTTYVGQSVLAANAITTIIASTSVASIGVGQDPAVVFAPSVPGVNASSTWLNFKAGGVPTASWGGHGLKGRCNAEFIKMVGD